MIRVYLIHYGTVLLLVLLAVFPRILEKLIPKLHFKKWVKWVNGAVFILPACCLLMFMVTLDIALRPDKPSKDKAIVQRFLEAIEFNTTLPEFKFEKHTEEGVGGDDFEEIMVLKFKTSLSKAHISSLDSLCRVCNTYGKRWEYVKAGESASLTFSEPYQADNFTYSYEFDNEHFAWVTIIPDEDKAILRYLKI